MTKVSYYWIVELTCSINTIAAAKKSEKKEKKTKKKPTCTQIIYNIQENSINKQPKAIKKSLFWEQQANKEVRITRGKLQS